MAIIRTIVKMVPWHEKPLMVKFMERDRERAAKAIKAYNKKPIKSR